MWWFLLFFHIAVRQASRWLPLQMLRFSDDIVIIAQDEINLKRALGSLDDILKSKYKMKIYKKNKLWSAPKILKTLILKWMTIP
jgi:hypothetical protein